MIEVEIESGILKNLSEHLPKGKKIAIIADEAVVESIARKLPVEGKIFSFPSGETSKTRVQKEKLENLLFENGFGRDTLIISVGGGVASDLVGFVAATFCRGVAWVAIPTTLLAMVDAAIGGKTGVDTPYGKNLVGAIHQPVKILIDPEVLKTLPKKVFHQGLAEALKHGIVLDKPLFEFMKSHREAILNRDLQAVERIIQESVRLKSEIVKADEKELGLRRLLNFGHTVGHALESLSNYQLSHGEAVAQGMLVESKYLKETGVLEEKSYQEIKGILNDYGFQFEGAQYPFDRLWKVMTHDKKAKGGVPRISGIKAIGEPLEFDGAFSTPLNPEKFRSALTSRRTPKRKER